MNLDSKELFKRTIKYAIHFTFMYLMLRTLPQGCLSYKELILVCMLCASSYAILDMLMPAIAPIIKLNA